MRSANASVKYSIRHERPRARTCGCRRLRPSDGDSSGPNGIETRTTSVMSALSGRRSKRRRFTIGRYEERMACVAVPPRQRELGVCLLRVRELTAGAKRARELQLREGMQRVRRLIAALLDDAPQLRDRASSIVDRGVGEAADVRQPRTDDAIVRRGTG